MSQPTWQRIESLFLQAVELAPLERAAFLERACAEDPDARVEITAMLLAHEEGDRLRIEMGLQTGGSDVSSTTSLAPGTRVDSYRIQSLIGEGGMSEVYRAERVGEYRQTVALKVLRLGCWNGDMVRRFRTEREILAHLVHPDIAPILDGGATPDGRPYLVLQYVDGLPITEHCERNGIDLSARLQLFRRVAEAVQFAHGKLIVHRDIKPSNILITPAGDPSLLDFGIAKLLEPLEDEPVLPKTRPELRLLTPEHAAPEQLLDEPVSTATDVYALGVLLFELLTGRRPFASSGRNAVELQRAIIEEPAPAPSSVVAGRAHARRLRGDLDRIVLMALRKEPARRYNSAGQLAEDVERFLAGMPVRARPATLGYRTGRFVRRHASLVAAGTVLVLLLCVFSAMSVQQARHIARERDRAQRGRASAEAMLDLLTGVFRHTNPAMVPGNDTVHVLTLLDEGARRVDELDGDPALQTRTRRVLASMYASRNRYERAGRLLERAHRQQLQVGGPEDPTAAAIYHELAHVVRSQRGGAAALPMLDSSLVRLRRSLGTEHGSVAQAMQDLAFATGDTLRRRALLDSALALRLRLGQTDSLRLASSLNAHGSDLLDRAQARDALPFLHAAHALIEKLQPPDHPLRLAVRRKLAAAFEATGEYERAEIIARDLLELRVRAGGVEDLGMANNIQALGMLAAHQGRLEEAEASLRKSLAMHRRLQDPSHASNQNALRNLAVVIIARGRVAEGLALLDSAMVRAGAQGRGWQAGYINGQRVPALLRLGRLTEATAALRTARASFRGTGPPVRPRRLDVEGWAGAIALAQGEAQKAAAHFAIALSGYRGLYAPTHPKVSGSECGLGIALAVQRHVEKAAPLLRHGCPIYERWGLAEPLLVEWGRSAMQSLTTGRLVAK